MAQFYNVVFAGEIMKGSDPAAVKANVARLFKASDAMLEKLFSGERVVVKKAVDQATAMKYRAVMRQAGAIAQVVEVDEQGRPLVAAAAPVAVAAPPVAPPAPPARPAAPPPAAAKPQTMAERLAAQAPAAPAVKPAANVTPPPADDRNAATWKVHPAGEQLGQAPDTRLPVPLPDLSHVSVARPGTELLTAAERQALEPVPVAVDTSGLSLAAAGGELLKAEEKRVVPVPTVDVSGLSMAPAGTEVLKAEERRVVVPVAVDISSLSMAPPGAPLDQIKDEKPPVKPDTSHLKLA